MTQHTTAATESVTEIDHLVVGAGFAGLCAAIKLEEDGERDFVVLEQGSDVGGTWRDNTYPGAACDVPSQLYSFSFAPNKEWSRSFSGQPEIQAYLQRVARDSGTLDRFRFDTAVRDARWDEHAQRWIVETDRTTYAARTLISGTGALSEPRLPDIDGIDSFAGEVFHSARWDHDSDLTGKRIAVIGTGASAIQIVPELQQVARELHVYQRTAPWVIPRHDRTYSGLERFALRHVPGLQQLYRTAIYWGRETYVPVFTRWPRLAAPVERVAKANIRRGISDPELQRKVTPDFRLGCKRVLISNDYYPALDADNVELVTDPISRVTPTGIVTADPSTGSRGTGTEREIDVLVVATGFHTTDMPIAEHITGRDGRALSEVWAEHGQSAYKGTTVSGFPNLFFIVGPNTGLGHSSMVLMIESQVTYIRKALRQMRRNDYAELEVREDAEAAWREEMQRRMQPTVWNTGGCSSWYLDEHGNNTTLWPRTTFAFRGELAGFDIDAYDVAAPAGAREPATLTGSAAGAHR